MNLTESPIASDMHDQMESSLQAAAGLLKLDLVECSPYEVICALDQFVLQLQKQTPAAEDMDATLLTLGIAWGEQLVAQFDWQWARVTLHDHDDANLVGVFSWDRSLAIYPFLFLYGCLENQAEVAIQLAFEVLVEGKRVPQLPSYGYENVMDHVHHRPNVAQSGPL